MAHYIDDNWEMQELVVDFAPLRGKYDKKNIADGFFNILLEFDIASKINNFLHIFNLHLILIFIF